MTLLNSSEGSLKLIIKHDNHEVAPFRRDICIYSLDPYAKLRKHALMDSFPACLLVSFRSVWRQYEKWGNDCGDCQCKQSSGGQLAHDLQTPLMPREKGAGCVRFTQTWEQGPTDARTRMTNWGKRGSLSGQWRSSSGWVGREVNIGFSC